MKERCLCCFTKSVEPVDYYESSLFWYGKIVNFIVEYYVGLLGVWTKME
jgi:hypothetical protein